MSEMVNFFGSKAGMPWGGEQTYFLKSVLGVFCNNLFLAGKR